jgi:hypothetical protein
MIRLRPAGDGDVAHAATLRGSVPVQVAFVVRPHFLVREPDRCRDAIHKAPDRGIRSVSSEWVASCADLMVEDGLADQLLDGPAAEPVIGAGSTRAEAPGSRRASQARGALIHLRRANGTTSHLCRGSMDAQPLTPPTVIPSMKKRWKKTKRITTGTTTSVAAAISRLKATSWVLRNSARPIDSG